MTCSLKCFCDFLEADTPQQRSSIIKRHKKVPTDTAKGMMVYYSPALQLMRKRLCPDGDLSEKLRAMSEKCHIEKWPEKLNQARLEANTLVFKAFHAAFGNKKLQVFSSPRLQCVFSSDVVVNLQPELYAEVDGIAMVWKLGLSKDSPNERTIRCILQMLHRGLAHKGFRIAIKQIRYFDVRAGKIYAESVVDLNFLKTLRPVVTALAQAWESAA